jgi:hypothetical protein
MRNNSYHSMRSLHVRDDDVCRRLMTVSHVVALTYRSTVDVPARVRKSKAVGAAMASKRRCRTARSGKLSQGVL